MLSYCLYAKTYQSVCHNRECVHNSVNNYSVYLMWLDNIVTSLIQGSHCYQRQTRGLFKDLQASHVDFSGLSHIKQHFCRHICTSTVMYCYLALTIVITNNYILVPSKVFKAHDKIQTFKEFLEPMQYLNDIVCFK